jgi:hypothetical protein
MKNQMTLMSICFGPEKLTSYISMPLFPFYIILEMTMMFIMRTKMKSVQVSISPTFYEQLLCQNPFANKLQT